MNCSGGGGAKLVFWNWRRGLLPLWLLMVLVDVGKESGGKATFVSNQFPRFQKNYWYEYSTPPSTTFPEYIDYHLSPETMTPPPNMPLILNGGGDGGWANVTAQLGAKAVLHCLVHNRQEKTVSFLRRSIIAAADRPAASAAYGVSDPILLTFGNNVYTNDVRITVEMTKRKSRRRRRRRRRKQHHGGSSQHNHHDSQHNHNNHHSNSHHDVKHYEEWTLNILNSRRDDEAVYECQVSTEPPLILRTWLEIEAPVLTVMDGFGRELLDQYYKAGSSLEVMCAVDRLPAHPLPNVIEWRHGDRTLPLRNTSLGQSIRTEMDSDSLGGATSHMAIAQASLAHSGIYTCSVSDSISQSLRLHIIDESKPVPITNNSTPGLRTMASVAWTSTILCAALFRTIVNVVSVSD